MRPIRVLLEMNMRSLTLNNLATKTSTEQRTREESSKTLLRRLREAREQEAAEERARRENVLRRLQRAG